MVDSTGGITPTMATLVLGLIGSALTYLAYRLNRRGQHEELRQKRLADRVTERSQAFDELESVNARLAEENERLRAEIDRQYVSAERWRREQTALCRTQLEGVIGAMATLQSVVLAEVATVAGQRSIESALHHIASHGQEGPNETTRE